MTKKQLQFFSTETETGHLKQFIEHNPYRNPNKALLIVVSIVQLEFITKQLARCLSQILSRSL